MRRSDFIDLQVPKLSMNLSVLDVDNCLFLWEKKIKLSILISPSPSLGESDFILEQVSGPLHTIQDLEL